MPAKFDRKGKEGEAQHVLHSLSLLASTHTTHARTTTPYPRLHFSLSFAQLAPASTLSGRIMLTVHRWHSMIGFCKCTINTCASSLITSHVSFLNRHIRSIPLIDPYVRIVRIHCVSVSFSVFTCLPYSSCIPTYTHAPPRFTSFSSALSFTFATSHIV